MAEKLNIIQKDSYCNCKTSCNSESAPRVSVPKDIDYAIIAFGETPDTDKIVYWAKLEDIKPVLNAADEREICLGSNTKILSALKKDLSGPYRVVTLRKTGQENGRELEKYFHFYSELPEADGIEETDYRSPRKKNVERTHNLLRIPLYDGITGKEADVAEFINQFKERVIKKDNKEYVDKKDTSYYSSLICRTVSGIAGTSCSLVESYVNYLLEGRGREKAFDEDELFGEQFGDYWKHELRDAGGAYINLDAVINFNNAVLDEDSSVKLLLKEKVKPDNELIDRAKKLKSDKADLDNYKNTILRHLQQKLISTYSGHPDIEAIISEQNSVVERMDLAKKRFDEGEDKSLEYFLHLYQLADLELTRTEEPIVIVHNICDSVGGEEHHKLHQKADTSTHKVLLTNLDVDNPNHWQMYVEKYRGIVDDIVLFRKHGK